MKHQLATPPSIQLMGTYVSQLQQQWQFPSDHLPMGITFDKFNIVSWNVLDADYMDWVIEKNSQGLRHSLIAEEHVYIDTSQLPLRDRHVIDLILQMLHHPSHPKNLLSLQECGKPFLDELKRVIPSNFTLVFHEGESVLFDQHHFEILDARAITGTFSEDLKKTFQDILFRRKDNGVLFRTMDHPQYKNTLLVSTYSPSRAQKDREDRERLLEKLRKKVSADAAEISVKNT